MLWVKKVRISNDHWKGKVRNSEPLYRVCGHVNFGLERKSPDFRGIGGEKVRISAVLEGKKVQISDASEEKKSGFPMIILWKKVRNSEPLYRGCAHIFWNSPLSQAQYKALTVPFLCVGST